MKMVGVGSDTARAQKRPSTQPDEISRNRHCTSQDRQTESSGKMIFESCETAEQIV
jgi:hypothetical protein